MKTDAAPTAGQQPGAASARTERLPPMSPQASPSAANGSDLQLVLYRLDAMETKFEKFMGGVVQREMYEVKHQHLEARINAIEQIAATATVARRTIYIAIASAVGSPILTALLRVWLG